MTFPSIPALRTDPEFLRIALSELGVTETPGPKATPRVLEYLSVCQLPSPLASSDETPWCSAFVNWCMKAARLKHTGRANARSWERYGAALPMQHERLPRGAIAVLTRGDKPYHGHVAFVVSSTTRRVLLLGGNQLNCVSLREYERARLIALRWPLELPIPTVT